MSQIAERLSIVGNDGNEPPSAPPVDPNPRPVCLHCVLCGALNDLWRHVGSYVWHCDACGGEFDRNAVKLYLAEWARQMGGEQ